MKTPSVDELRISIGNRIWGYDDLTDSERTALVNKKQYADHPQPVAHRSGASASLAIVEDGSRCRFAHHFQLCAHFLQSRSKRFDLLLLFGDNHF